MRFDYLLLQLTVIGDHAHCRIQHEKPQENSYGKKVTVAVYIIPKKRIEIEIKKECYPEQDEQYELDKLKYLEITISVCLHYGFLSQYDTIIIHQKNVKRQKKLSHFNGRISLSR